MRENTLTTKECFDALTGGYILENEYGYRVWLYKGKQIITNTNRLARKGRKKYAYKFDYPTWQVVGRIPLTNKLINWIYIGTRKLSHLLCRGGK